MLTLIPAVFQPLDGCAPSAHSITTLLNDPIAVPDTVIEDPALNQFETTGVTGDMGLVIIRRLAGAFTVREMFVTAVRDPDVPTILTKNAPPTTPVPQFNVRVLFPTVNAGENELATPLGRPEMESATAPANPVMGATFTAIVTDVPGVIATMAGDAVT